MKSSPYNEIVSFYEFIELQHKGKTISNVAYLLTSDFFN